MIPDQTHLLHAIEHLIIARQELWEYEKSPYMCDIAKEIDTKISRLASRLG